MYGENGIQYEFFEERKIRGMKLKHSLYLMIFLCSFVPVCIWLGFSVYDTENRMEEIVSNNIEAIAGSQIMSIQNFCEGRKDSMETIARLEVVRDAILGYDANVHDEKLDAFLLDNKLHKSYVASLSVVDKDFHVIGSSEQYEIFGVSDFKYSNPAYHTGDFVIGNIYDRETDDGLKRIIPAYTGVYYEGELIGYLIEEIECDYFDRLRLNTDFLEEGTLYLLDGEMQLITAGTSDEEESRKQMITSSEERADYERAWNEFDHENNSSGIIHYSYDGDKYMTYFSDVMYTDWNIRITENMSAQWESNRSIYFMLFLEGSLMLAMLVVVQVFMTKKLVAPVNRITRTLKEIQEKDDYSIRTDVKRKDEVGVIAEGIDELLDFIEKEELEEKRKQREFAEEAMHRAEASNRAKSTFLFNASHDIRTPMNAIWGFTHIIEENANDSEKVLDAAGKIKKSTDVLMGLLNNVLELSQIESGKDEPECKVVNLQELSEKVYLMFAKEMNDFHLHFEVDNRIKDNLVWADELKITRILMNMLSNAKKFTPKKGHIVLGIKQETEESGYATYRFFVKDNGIGMSPEFRKKAFEQFEMERSSTVSGVVGNGLGLAIIKKLTEQMDGSCELESKQNVGTTIAAVFKFRIAASEIKVEKQTEETFPLAGKRVLLVEDNEFNREIARYMLENVGIIVEESEDGSTAVECLKHAAPGEFDFVLMDIQMPIMDGYEATKAIRAFANKELAEIPIIAMTANAFKEDRDKCLLVGMNEHIGKPVDEEKLFKVLKQFI